MGPTIGSQQAYLTLKGRLFHVYHSARHAFEVPHLVQGIVFGLGVLVASLLLYDPLFEWSGYGQVIRFESEWANAVSLKLAFGQVYMAFVGVFLAGTLGYFAIKEFTQAQAGPKLRLSFDDGAGGLELRMDGAFRFSVELHNDSREVAVWYMVKFYTPFMYTYWAQNRPHPSDFYRPLVGTIADNWREFGGPYTGMSEGVMFLSNGSFAAYHRLALRLCEFVVPVNCYGTEDFTCHWVIGSDRREAQHGTLRLRLVNALPATGADE